MTMFKWSDNDVIVYVMICLMMIPMCDIDIWCLPYLNANDTDDAVHAMFEDDHV